MSIEHLVSEKLRTPRLVLDILMIKYLIAARNGETRTHVDVPAKYRQQLVMTFSKLNHRMDDITLSIETLRRHYVNGKLSLPLKVRCHMSWSKNPIIDSV